MKNTKSGMYRHGMSNTKMYHKWESMKQRCLNPNNPYFENYGGRGISVCLEWYDFVNFRDWCLENGYSDDLELDRIDNDGNYEPDNCRFINHVANNYNKRTNARYRFKGKMLTVKELSEVSGINPATIRKRLFKGMTAKEAVETPVRKVGRYNASYYKSAKTQKDLRNA